MREDTEDWMQTLRSVMGILFILITLATTFYRCSEREAKKLRMQSGPHYVLGDTYAAPFNEYSFRYPYFWFSRPTADTVSIQALDFPADITTYERTFAGPVAQCVEKVKDEWRTNNPEITLLREADFVTDTGVVGRKIKVKVKTKQDARENGVTIYFFDITERRKLIISCRVPLEKDQDMESLFDDCMKTFAVAARSPTPLPAGGNTRP